MGVVLVLRRRRRARAEGRAWKEEPADKSVDEAPGAAVGLKIPTTSKPAIAPETTELF